MIPGGNTARMAWLLLALPVSFAAIAVAQQSVATAPQSVEFFEARIRPVLASNCYDCHTDQRNGGLRVDSREALLKGGRRGPAIVPGDPDNSLLMQAVRQTNDALKMPKGGRLAPAEIDALAEWIRGGAVWPAAPPAGGSGGRSWHVAEERHRSLHCREAGTRRPGPGRPRRQAHVDPARVARPDGAAARSEEH